MSFILSDGDRSIDLQGTGSQGIWASPEGIQLPVPARDDTFSEPVSGDGRFRVSTRQGNPTGGCSGYIAHDTITTFWDYVDQLQELVESAHQKKGTITTDLSGTWVTYNLESVSISGLPVAGVLLRQGKCEFEVTFECQPFAVLTQDWIMGLTNLITNPGFESNTTGWSTTTATLTRITSDYHTGSACGQVAVASSNNRGIALTSLVTVSASTRYSAHCYVKASSSSDVGKVVYLRLEEQTSGAVNVGQTDARVTLTSKWQKVKVSRLFGGTGVRAKVHVLNVTSAAMTWLVDDVRLFASEVITGPIDYFTVSNVGGHVPALGALNLFDTSSQNRNHIEVGLQANFDPNNAEPIHLAAVTDLTALAGSSTTRAGSNSTNVLRASVSTNPVGICTSGTRYHKGLWRFRCRVYVSAATVSVRLSWRVGSGAWSAEPWKTVPAASAWYDVDLGVVDIPQLVSGHSFEFKVEAISSSGLPTVDVDFVEPIPADNWTRLRGGRSDYNATSGVVAYDDFSTQTSGAVTGKTPQLVPSGTFTGAGDADDFTVDTTNKWIYRNATADSAQNNGRYLRVGSGTATTITAQVDAYLGTLGLGETRAGVFVRYVDTNNWLWAGWIAGINGPGVSPYPVLIKRVAGTETYLSYGSFVSAASWRTIYVTADAAGNVLAAESAQGSSPTSFFGVAIADSNLATGGTIASGGYGIYDANTGSGTTARLFDNFQVTTPAGSSALPYPALYSGRGLDLSHNTALNEDSAGTSLGTVPSREGEYLTIPPATRAGRYSRIVIRARRNDIDSGLTDDGLSDVLTADLDVAPRRLIV